MVLSFISETKEDATLRKNFVSMELPRSLQSIYEP